MPWEILAGVLMARAGEGGAFGGVMGWEYFNSLPGGRAAPWEWAAWMTVLLGGGESQPAVIGGGDGEVTKGVIGAASEADPDEDGRPAEVPGDFAYHSDGIEEEE